MLKEANVGYGKEVAAGIKAAGEKVTAAKNKLAGDLAAASQGWTSKKALFDAAEKAFLVAKADGKMRDALPGLEATLKEMKMDLGTAEAAWDRFQGEADTAAAKEAAAAGIKTRKDADDAAKTEREGKVKKVNDMKDAFDTAVAIARKDYGINTVAELKTVMNAIVAKGAGKDYEGKTLKQADVD